MTDRHYRVLNLGAGVQSTMLYLMAIDGELENGPIDYAIFADVGDEPRDVYEHLEFLKSLGGPEIRVVSKGNLGDNLKNGVNSTGQRFVSIPTFLSVDGQDAGMGRRQCTSEFKIQPIEQEIRRIVGAEKGKRVPKGTTVTQLFGLSFDEPKRVIRVRDQFRGSYWKSCEFPLFDDFITRRDCVAYLKKRLPNRDVPRSACVYCPYHNDDEWLRIKADPEAWALAVEIDEAIRDNTSAATQGMNATQYLHRSCQPLVQIDFQASKDDGQKVMSFSAMDCEGMCGL